MSNLIDADAGTERFSGYEAELKLVQADLQLAKGIAFTSNRDTILLSEIISLLVTYVLPPDLQMERRSTSGPSRMR